MTEQWRPVPGFDGYEVSDLGRVISRRRRTPVMLAERVGSKGYRKVALSRGPYDVTDMTLHRVVLLAFIGPCPEGLQVRHLDGDPGNNRLDNLAYGTPSENMHDVVRHGRHHQVNKTHCPQGHPYVEANVWYGDRGQRRCKTCYHDRGKGKANVAKTT